MKSKLVAAPCSEPKSLPYPKLMVTAEKKDLIVLFDSKSSGTVMVCTSGRHKIGYHSLHWCDADFEDLPLGQSVVLGNDGVAQ